jgi:A/G-specific adenine glycosylase
MKAKAPTSDALRRKLLRWYDRNRRDLPWRRTADPYRIWVSEVMLQQTRVQAVIPYYRNFLRHFPNLRALAAAREEELLACWSGLGYYSRARNLQRAAQVMVREHQGKFPRDYEAALALPGVGRYTAAAVLSIAYGKALAVLDGNVARVLSRLCAIPADVKTARGKEKLGQLASELVSPKRPGDFNQAMMELGATVCLPQQPRCPQCPLRRHCTAYARDEVEHFPPPRKKVKPVERRLLAVFIQDSEGRCLMVRRPQRANWLAGFWELPMWEQESDDVRPGIALEKQIGTVRHTITENRMLVRVFSASMRGKKIFPSGRWMARSEFASSPITTISRKALALRDDRQRNVR